MKKMQRLGLITAAVLLSACAPVSTPEVASMPVLTPPAMIVNITDENCPSLEIESGFTVGWINTGKQVHILQSQLREDGSRLLDAGTLQPGDWFAMTFIDPGTISYICSEDGSLKGIITVTESASQADPVQPQLGSGVAHSCMLTLQGKVVCWGQGVHPSQEISPDTYGKPKPLEGVDAISLASGWYHTCAATRDGQVKCWGQNANGQLGNGTTEDSFTPVHVTGLTDVSTVTAGAAHSCALTHSGEVFCWGQNSQHQLGDGTMTDHSNPVQVADLDAPATNITAGPTYTCATLEHGQVDCWGQITFFPGEGNEQIHPSPVSIPSLNGKDLEKIAAGDYHLCVLTRTGEVLCGGSFFTTGSPDFSKPLEVLGKLQGHIVDILAGTDFTCVLADSGKVYCWGDDYFDQLGDGLFVTSLEPKEVTRAGNNIAALGGGHYTACALSADGKVICWGDTSFGQLGDGTARWK